MDKNLVHWLFSPLILTRTQQNVCILGIYCDIAVFCANHWAATWSLTYVFFFNVSRNKQGKPFFGGSTSSSTVNLRIAHLRIGYLVGNPEVADIRELFLFLSYGLSPSGLHPFSAICQTMFWPKSVFTRKLKPSFGRKGHQGAFGSKSASLLLVEDKKENIHFGCNGTEISVSHPFESSRFIHQKSGKKWLFWC